MGTYLPSAIGDRFCELMSRAGESVDRLASRVHKETGMNEYSACNIISKLRFRQYLNRRKVQAQVRANQISLIFGFMNVHLDDVIVRLMGEECAKLGLQFEYPLCKGSKLRAVGIAREPDEREVAACK